MKKVSEAIGNNRLLKLAAFLRTVPRKRFDYSVFVGGDWAGAQDLSCGTQACALGWAATMPTFRRLGLHLDVTGAPVLSREIGSFQSAAKLFGIDPSAADYLFAPGIDGRGRYEDYATPKYVARKIERFVKGRQAASA